MHLSPRYAIIAFECVWVCSKRTNVCVGARESGLLRFWSKYTNLEIYTNILINANLFPVVGGRRTHI